MKNNNLKRIGLAMAILLGAGYAEFALAHTAGGPIDGAGNNASATDYAIVSCYDDGDGPTDHLYMQIEDTSPPVPGMIMSFQASKDGKMTNTSDVTSGDGQPGPVALLFAGDGSYYVSVNKTLAGLRNFVITYHCQTAGNVHTGTDINTVLQLQ